ncbi:unnamed protein product, partial [Cyprideis torosa]
KSKLQETECSDESKPNSNPSLTTIQAQLQSKPTPIQAQLKSKLNTNPSLTPIQAQLKSNPNSNPSATPVQSQLQSKPNSNLSQLQSKPNFNPSPTPIHAQHQSKPNSNPSPTPIQPNSNPSPTPISTYPTDCSEERLLMAEVNIHTSDAEVMRNRKTSEQHQLFGSRIEKLSDTSSRRFKDGEGIRHIILQDGVDDNIMSLYRHSAPKSEVANVTVLGIAVVLKSNVFAGGIWDRSNSMRDELCQMLHLWTIRSL